MAEVTVMLSGPIFDGRAAHEVTEYLKAVRYDVAAQGYSDVMDILNASIKHPTPYYELQINVRDEGNRRVINDRGVVYGWWLEKGDRNHITFLGYHSFQFAANRLEKGEAEELAERKLEEYVRRME